MGGGNTTTMRRRLQVRKSMKAIEPDRVKFELYAENQGASPDIDVGLFGMNGKMLGADAFVHLFEQLGRLIHPQNIRIIYSD